MQDMLSYCWGACSLHSLLCLLKPFAIVRAMEPSRCPPFFRVTPCNQMFNYCATFDTIPPFGGNVLLIARDVNVNVVNDSFGLTLIMPIESRVNPSTNEARFELSCPRRGFFGY